MARTRTSSQRLAATPLEQKDADKPSESSPRNLRSRTRTAQTRTRSETPTGVTSKGKSQRSVIEQSNNFEETRETTPKEKTRSARTTLQEPTKVGEVPNEQPAAVASLKRRRNSTPDTGRVKRRKIPTLNEELSDQNSGQDKQSALVTTFLSIRNCLENSSSVLLDTKQLILKSKQPGMKVPEIKWQSDGPIKFKGDEISFSQPVNTQAAACIYIKLAAGAERQELAQHLIDHMLPHNELRMYYLYFAEDEAIYVLNVEHKTFFQITSPAKNALESPAIIFEYIVDTLK